MALLELQHVTKRFGGLIAVDRVSLEVQAGELLAIVGPNGAGKTTLFNVMSGVLLPDAGHIFFEERDITSVPAHKRAPLGIGRTFQIPRPFSAASIRENVAIGVMFGTLARKVTVDDALEIADHYIRLVGLQGHRDNAAGTLTPVEKKLLEMARALAMQPKLLLLDEAMAGMNPRDIDQIVALLKQLKQEETHLSIIAMVEHIMRAVVGLAERVVVMHQGATLVDAPTAEALSDPRVVEVYLGYPKRA
jgi:branched-chain amino acid transport system ATP-binding protein